MAWQIDGPVIVPFDFSDHSRAAFMHAVQLTTPENIHVVHVLPVFTPTEPGVGWGLIDDAQRFSQTAKAMENEIPPDDFDGVNFHVLLGDPGTVVADLAVQLDAELIAVGSHGRTGLSRLVVGSVAERVSRLAPCPVLLVKLPRQESEAEVEEHTEQGQTSDSDAVSEASVPS